jgi:hypothetical protein
MGFGGARLVGNRTEVIGGRIPFQVRSRTQCRWNTGSQNHQERAHAEART